MEVVASVIGVVGGLLGLVLISLKIYERLHPEAQEAIRTIAHWVFAIFGIPVILLMANLGALLGIVFAGKTFLVIPFAIAGLVAGVYYGHQFWEWLERKFFPMPDANSKP